MSLTNNTTESIILSGWIDNPLPESKQKTKQRFELKNFDLLKPLRHKLDAIKINNQKKAHKICRLIPSQCPFARKIQFCGRTLISIPPLCKINPLYEDLMALRFRAICYLADECGEDISAYC